MKRPECRDLVFRIVMIAVLTLAASSCKNGQDEESEENTEENQSEAVQQEPCPSMAERCSWNENGDLLVEEYDLDGDGVAITTTHTYDDQGRHTMIDAQRGDGERVDRTTFEYGDDGGVVRRIGGANYETAIRFETMDAAGNMLMSENDSDADGSIDRRTTFIYNEDGLRTAREEDRNADGVAEERCVYEQPCVSRNCPYTDDCVDL